VYGAISNYVALAAATLASLASVPLALHYLSRERFALWALMASIGGYFSLIDLGMSTSVARLLIDYKDKRQSGEYGCLVQTGGLVLVCQGFILLPVGLCIAPLLADMLGIQSDLRAEFIRLLRWQVIVWALSFCIRIFGQILYAHQRIDIGNYLQIVLSVLNFGLMWMFFCLGCGVMSLSWSALAVAFLSAALQWLVCGWLGLFPSPGCWGRPSWERFKELFAYGKDMFLVALGSQLIIASQTMIITAKLGLVPAALWSVGTKAYGLILQLVWKIFDAAAPGFAEMLVRKEQSTLLERYRTIVMLSTSFAAFCAVSYALCNDSFVTIWTHGRFAWPAVNDLLLGGCIVVSSIVHSHNSLVGLTKDIRFMRYVYFVEGAVFVLLALLLARCGGLAAIILISLVCSLLFTCGYGLVRVKGFFGLSMREVAWNWLSPMFGVLWRFGFLAIALWWATSRLPAWPRFLIHGAACGTAGLFLFAKYGVPPSMRSEVMKRLPEPAARLAAHILA
jgi:O-antigen/teichoic acid export membrane protein